MKYFRHDMILRALMATLMLGALGPSAQAEDTVLFEDTVRPFLDQYCVRCHKPDKTKGDIDLDRFKSTSEVLGDLETWERAGRRVSQHEMPPESTERQPTDAEREAFLKYITGVQEAATDCNIIASEDSQRWFPGYVMSRRLNRTEYENSMHDLLGIDTPLAVRFPADGAGGEGFDNNGNALFLSAIQAERYVDVADIAVEDALPPLDSLVPDQWKLADWVQWMRSDAAEAWVADRSRFIAAWPSPRRTAEEAAHESLRHFLYRAWRRPVTGEEVARLMSLYVRGRERGDDYETSLKLAFKGALVSPNFLFLAEPEPPEKGPYALGGYPLAARLSYFLWASMPDDELRALASHGLLQNDDVLRHQVARMLVDPKAEALGNVFAAQWLGITQIESASRPDDKLFPEFDDALAESMKQEVATYVYRMVAEDRPLIDLIDSDYTYVDDRLAALYDVVAPQAPTFQRVQLADARRGGVLGMGAVLTATSHSTRTSPVLRGKWVLEQLLGDRVPPPPPNVGELPEEGEHAEGLSLRERMVEHRKNPDCASCHARMDPIGFGLENFDAIGRFRTEDAGLPIDATGELPSGETFSGPQELKQILLAQKDRFVQNLARKTLGYALGRSLTRYDDCVVSTTVENLKANEYRAATLFTDIVMSYPFRHRFSTGEGQGEVSDES
jgi:hypothetical protein